MYGLGVFLPYHLKKKSNADLYIIKQNNYIIVVLMVKVVQFEPQEVQSTGAT